MKVFKFGGASIRNTIAIQNVVKILRDQGSSEKILVVVSAMGKTTNALERIVHLHFRKEPITSEIKTLMAYHQDIMSQLFHPGEAVFEKVAGCFEEIESNLSDGHVDFVYDQVVSLGEVISSIIISDYLKKEFEVEWIDARNLILTDSSYREAKINWKETEKKLQGLPEKISANMILTQGFIGSDSQGNTTTMGREGSDFSAAVFASCLNAESVTIWKDVPGVMSADPKRIPNAKVFEELPYKEAAEMTFYGATVIHPKTIKPLANKHIPLLVRNFDHPDLPGTRIHDCIVWDLPPLVIFKDNQCLISCRVTDYTFIDEQQLSIIFESLAKLNVRINLMQNSAISFSVCTDYREQKILDLTEMLGAHFEVYYNTGLTLVTIKNYDTETYEAYRSKNGILMEQSTRSTLQILIKT